ncbi:tumor necrosis factor receptor superfamily member 5 [Stegastes partitus]|uniref:Tumor necrosis factor receptor superfamily member 5-like n=1 Tax=Stegastes partitus TaxID=144197 RepID=A0A3B4ZMH0_9TELE|nr:PREDICTED: tumor necrosis factor receptor superfamily member 5-like [Stegastes partitus]
MVHFSNMSLYLPLLMLAFMVLASAQLSCDPQTQYERGGQCCLMCGKGTSMTSPFNCAEPHCTPCSENEYQDGYTTEVKCKRQPYCDPNSNFEEVRVHQSKTAKTICKCKTGFHCSGETCQVCVAHEVCPPGFGAQPKGNHNHDTTCIKCPDGTFSDESSWESACKNMTECNGFYIKHKGTPTSDRKCEPSRMHLIAICVSLALLLVGAVIVLWLTRGHFKAKAKPCIEYCQKEEHKPLREKDAEVVIRIPVEDEVEPSLQEISSEGLLTDMGNPVREENGKAEILPRQESQIDTCGSSEL